MIESQEISRVYRGPDAYMVQTARVIYGLFNQELPKFTAFDNTLVLAHATAFLSAITAAETVVADTSVKDQLVQKTEQVQIYMDKARMKYADVKYFVQKAFPSSLATQNEFGLNDYHAARTKTNQMVQFLDEMHKACVKYQTQLVAKGYNAPAIAEIQTIRTDLLSLNTAKETFKKTRLKLTEDRITVLNACYKAMMQINAAAQLIYRNDFAKRKQYVYNASNGAPVETYKGNVNAQEIKEVTTIDPQENNLLTFKNTGTTVLVFCLSTSKKMEGTLVNVQPGKLLRCDALDLSETATHLLVHNLDFTQLGTYEVVVE